MNQSPRETEFIKAVTNRFNIYNSLFLSLPFRKIANIGNLIPLLNHECRKGLESGKEPLEILDTFFRVHTKLETEEEKIDFMFRVIQYVERQVVLFDSVEDTASDRLLKLGKHLSLTDCTDMACLYQSTDTLVERMSDFSVRIVFTAHPTQFYPRSVLDIIEKLRCLVRENKIDEIEILLQQLGLTSLMNARKPTPLDEARNIIYFLRSVYYEAVGDLYAYIKENIPTDDFENPEIIQLGFWPGGDRDGNPFVTSKTTALVADELRMTLMKCYYNEVKGLQEKLTFKVVEDHIAALKEQLYAAMFDPLKTISVTEMLGQLNRVQELLCENFSGMYLESLEHFIDKIKIFKTHFASMDIRQNHTEHEKVITQILKNEKRIKNSLDELSEQDLVSILVHEHFTVYPDQFEEEIIKDTIQTVAQIKSIQKKNGEAGCNRYIISNSEDIFAVLFVFALLRWCGWQDGKIPVDIIPLFESMDGMKHAESIMRTLFDFPEYRSHIRFRGDRQTIMLGFSDGTKDGGYLQANWSIFKTKEVLSAVCDQHRIKAVFFDGRGGPPARGGGKAHRFYAAQGRRIANHAIQLTIQGQTITSQYGTRSQFIHHCEQLLTAGLSPGLSETGDDIPEKSRQIIERMANLSHEKYTALKNHKRFLSYLENKSTLKYYGMANIGSRPAKRGKADKLTLKDLRAISFVGSWSQLRQNVPGYFGIGTALKVLADDVGMDELRQLYREVPFFKALILNSMMSMSKCFFGLTAYISRDEEYKDFWNILFEEFELSKQMTLLVSDSRFLMEEEPISSRSIQIRENIVLPLLTIQQYAFQKIDNGADYIQAYEKIIQRSLYGNINASRNSA
ncbi:phosphoenolpyruvate carboxylase [Desulfatitalea alkaliphila]|uniref:Phosphoenolpyruvate carboxylase n=1 Tax=Desulfatitalea alkaliphila TaxID=2929485 RepID=A0AA41R2S5_9BACT|nr:phosphoenolpyruvate carboxylase [Desulfatitalea alkaliphila]MCJ8500125.1 phosphoenolpyruvate carboxylase [Desulfatitalea alkaliphila]